jgi:MFS family permease
MYTQVIGIMLPQVQKEFGLSYSQASLMQVAMMLGLLLGSLFWGSLSDVIGRRPSFMITLGICSFFAIACAFAPSYALLCVGIVLMTFGVGGIKI